VVNLSLNRLYLIALGLIATSSITSGCRTPRMGELPLSRSFTPPPMLESEPEVESFGEPIVDEGVEGVSTTLGDTPAAPLWTNNYEDALNRANSEGKQVLAFFTGSDFCQPCMQLNQEVLESAEFQNWARDRFVLLELDYPKRTQLSPELESQNRELLMRYGVRSFPTVLALSPQGEVLGKSAGYRGNGPAAWTSAIDSQLLR